MKNTRKIVLIASILIVIIIGISFIFRPSKDKNQNKTPDENINNEEKQYLCNENDNYPISCKNYIKSILYHSDDGDFTVPTYDMDLSNNVYYSKDEYENLSSKIDNIHISYFEYLITQCNTLNKKVMLSNDVSIEIRVRIAIIKYLSDNIDRIKEIYIGQKIKESEIVEIINKIFSDKISSLDNINNTKGAIPCKFLYEYNKKENVITITGDNSGCGGPGNFIEEFDTKLEETSTGINIYTRFMFGYLDDVNNDGLIYKAYSDLIEDDNNYIGIYSKNATTGKNYLNNKIFDSNNYNLLQQYKFVFKFNNGNYLFESIEKVN